MDWVVCVYIGGYVKKVVVILSLMICESAYAADSSNPYKPAIPMTNPDTGEGYLAGMPTEMKAQIIMTIRTAATLQEAVTAIRALAVSSKEFNAVINDARITKGLVHMLVAKFGRYHENVAHALGTVGAKKYADRQSEFVNKWMEVKTVQQAKNLVEQGAELNFSDAIGSTPLVAVL